MMKSTYTKLLFSFLIICLSTKGIMAQNILGQDRVPVATMLSALLTPDQKGASLGDAGVAGPSDVNSIYWNPAKLGFTKSDLGFNLSYNPWLRNITNDMAYYNISGFTKSKTKNQVYGFSLNYFDLGTISSTGNSGNFLGTYPSKEYVLTGSISQQMSKRFSLGVNLKYINSSPLVATTVITAQTVAADLGMYWAAKESEGNKWRTSYGINLSNISGKVSYGANDKSFIPTNLRFGLATSKNISAESSFTLYLDFNKLMVPTPDANNGSNLKDVTAIGGIFSSLFDAPDGFGEELREISTSIGADLNLNKLISLRAGYFHEDKAKGNRNYFTTGLGLKIDQKYHLDFSYILPTESSSPLANTLRISLVGDISRNVAK